MAEERRFNNSIGSGLSLDAPRAKANRAPLQALLGAEFLELWLWALVPLVFLHDVNGFMVGKDAEWSGIIRAGAKMVSAVSTSVVPKITVIVGGSFGAGHYAMCGKTYDPRFIFAWPTARYAVMSGASAAGTLAELRAKQMERSGQTIDEARKKALYDEIKATYDAQTDPQLRCSPVVG